MCQRTASLSASPHGVSDPEREKRFSDPQRSNIVLLASYGPPRGRLRVREGFPEKENAEEVGVQEDALYEAGSGDAAPEARPRPAGPRSRQSGRVSGRPRHRA